MGRGFFKLAFIILWNYQKILWEHMWNFQCSVPTEEDGMNSSVLRTQDRLTKQWTSLSKLQGGLPVVDGRLFSGFVGSGPVLVCTV